MTVSMTPTTDLILTRENITRNYIALALPAVGENLLTMMVFFSNTFLVGWMKDPAALAAVSLAGLFLQIAQSLFTAIAISATSLVAHYWGAREYERAREVAAHSVWFSFLAALLTVAILWPLAEQLLCLMGATERVVELGALYMRLVLSTSFFLFPMIVLNGVMRGSGDTRTPMVITGLMNVLNVVVAAVLIFGLGPIPPMGIAGAGIGTALARLLGGVLTLALIFTGRRFVKVGFRDLLIIKRGVIRDLIGLSVPNAAETVVMRLGSVLFMRIVSGLGEVTLAAHQVAVAVESLSFMPGFGFSAASTTLVGQSLGAGKGDLAEETTWRGLRFALAVMGLLAVSFALFGPQMAAFFGATPEVLELAGRAVQIGALEQLPLGALMVLSGSLRGAGDMKSPMYATFAGTFIARVPIVYLFANIFGWGLNGVWLGTAVDWTCRAAFIYFLFRRGEWKKSRP
ncbi:MAG: MATE family efflux transporter [Chloroflexi bacterium]|nr:MATE family efflux transporter [Chloroflexota bacterium]